MALEIITWNGHPISRPGIYRGVPLEKYHGDICAGPSISSSGLRDIFGKSPAHYWLTSPYNPKREERKDTEPFILGRAAHHWILGEADFDKLFVVHPDRIGAQAWNRNANACKDWLKEQADAKLTVLSPGQMKAILGMAESLAGEPLIQAGVLGGLVEHSLFYQDEETGIWIKARPDAVPTDAADFVDLKCVADVSDNAIENSIGEYGYHQQGAVIGSACKAVLDLDMNSFTLICTEKTAPHAVSSKTLKPADLELGDKQNDLALRLFKRGLETGRWPGPAGTQLDAAFVEIKPYHRTRIESRVALLEQELAA